MSRTSWWTGQVPVAVSATGALALDGDGSLLERLWAELERGVDVAEVLRVLVLAYDGSLLNLPDFLLVTAQEEGLRAVARGRFRLLDAAGAVLLHAPDPVAWEEVRVPAGTEVVMELEGGEPVGPGWLLQSGVVPASSLRLQGFSAAGAQPRISGQVEQPLPASSVPAEPVPVAPGTGLPGPAVLEVPEPAAGKPCQVFPAPQDPSEPGVETQPYEEPVYPDEPAVAGSPASAATLGMDHLDLVGEAESAPAEHPLEEPSVYAHHYGDHTMAVSLAEAAIAKPAEEPGLVTSVPKAGQPTTVDPADPVGSPSGAVADALPVTYSPEDPRPEPVSIPPEVVPGWMHDGHTVQVPVRRGARRGAHAASPAEAAQPAGPDREGTVLAVMCPAQHPNAVTALACRVCGAPVGGPSVHVPRPVLGRLRTSSQEEVVLHSDVVIGRAPQAAPLPNGTMPQLLAVACPDKSVSKTHCAVRVEGWDLLVEDLGSTNGTFLLRRGEAPRRVTRGAPEPLQAGDVLNLADSVTIAVEAYGV
ncbi:FHA domain-containing protein [Actinomyces weissii]|uniref:FHA domain-containing protein n=1 Tax=Actinomyces weissii TaxID=675090 RepID=A0A7T7MA47_9ACTO|nr:FHA domain-containing protein [Actinomyces weissii]QQM67715.1 FHA domain-containing protein [Actinomyces weissii]